MSSYTGTPFNQNEYIKQYQKEHYKQFKINIKPDLFTRIDDYCKDNKISRSEFLAQAIELLEKSKQ